MSKKIYFIFTVVFLIYGCCIFYLFLSLKNIKYLKIIPENVDTRYVFENPVTSNVKYIVIDAIPVEPMGYATRVRFDFDDGVYEKYYPGLVYNAYIGEYIGLGNTKLVIALGQGQDVETFMLEFSGSKNSVKQVKFIDKDKTVEDSLCCNYMLLIPQDNGLQYDIGMPDTLSGKLVIHKYEYVLDKYVFVEK